MNWLLEYFDNRKKVIQDGYRLRSFIDRAPELKSLGSHYAAAIESEQSRAPAPEPIFAPEIPSTLKEFLSTPPENLTLQILERGAHLSLHLAEESGVWFTPDYPELVRRMFAKKPNVLRNIHGSFISDLMAAEYVLYQPEPKGDQSIRHTWLFSVKHFEPRILFLNSLAVCNLRLPVFSEWRIKEIRDSVLLQTVKKYPEQASMLCKSWIGRQALVEQMIVDGFFPKDMDGNPHSSVKIKRKMPLKDALTSYMKCLDSEIYERTCLAGLIKRNSIEIVIEASDTPMLKRVLARLYAPETLLPFVSNDHFVKGRIIEDALGL